jgi:S-adenosylmethionine-diacylgycerolhomoserine-N-methlytransferase
MFADARVLLQMLRGMPARGDAASRLESFYGPQAAAYDAFRQRLLHGRSELLAGLILPPGATLVELGAGTGASLGFLGDRIGSLASFELVDLCPSLLAQARSRAAGFANVRVIAADACRYRPARPADCVIFSYSLSMIPDWQGALSNALAMLKPGGQLAVVDFALPSARQVVMRSFWRNWFAHDGVFLDDAHAAALRQLLPQHQYIEGRAPVPYLPGLRVPYYRFTGTLR